MASSEAALQIDADVLKRLKAVAQQEDRSASWLASRAIEAFLESRAFKESALREALAEADKGEFVSSEAMNRWVASWGGPNETEPPAVDVRLNRR